MAFQLIFFFFSITLLTLFHSLNIVHIQNIMGTEYLYCNRHCVPHKWTASNNRFYCCFFIKCRLHEGMKYRGFKYMKVRKQFLYPTVRSPTKQLLKINFLKFISPLYLYNQEIFCQITNKFFRCLLLYLASHYLLGLFAEVKIEKRAVYTQCAVRTQMAG